MESGLSWERHLCWGDTVDVLGAQEEVMRVAAELGMSITVAVAYELLDYVAGASFSSMLPWLLIIITDCQSWAFHQIKLKRILIILPMEIRAGFWLLSTAVTYPHAAGSTWVSIQLFFFLSSPMASIRSLIGEWLLHWGNAVQDDSTISTQQFGVRRAFLIFLGISLFFSFSL